MSSAASQPSLEGLFLGPPLTPHRYRLTGRAGHGQEGSVWKAKDTKTFDNVAVKMFSDDPKKIGSAAHTHSAITGLLARLPRDCDQLVTVLDTFEGAPPHGKDEPLSSLRSYVVMSWIEGQSLWDFAATSTGELRPLYDAARGLSALHAAGLVHLDVKPSNILVNRNDLSGALVDLGLVQSIGTRLGGTVHGTKGYFDNDAMSHPLHPRHDMSSLARCAVYALSGNPTLPKSEDPAEIANALADLGAPRPVADAILGALRHQVPDGMRADEWFAPFQGPDGGHRSRSAAEEKTVPMDKTRALAPPVRAPELDAARRFSQPEQWLFDTCLLLINNVRFAEALLVAIVLGLLTGAVLR